MEYTGLEGKYEMDSGLNQVNYQDQPLDKIQIKRVTLVGPWLIVVLNILNGTTVLADKFQENVCSHFRL